MRKKYHLSDIKLCLWRKRQSGTVASQLVCGVADPYRMELEYPLPGLSHLWGCSLSGEYLPVIDQFHVRSCLFPD